MELAHLHIEAYNGSASAQCVDHGIISFLSFIEWVEQLPYKRNSDRSDFMLIFEEGCGTCSTKHALIKQVALENQWNFVQLYLGIYKMSEATNPGISSVLDQHELEFIPEAHTYLRINNKISDRTGVKSGKTPFSDVLLHEEEIQPEQIGTFKEKMHKDFISEWSTNMKYSVQEIWDIRETCIQKLSKNSTI